MYQIIDSFFSEVATKLIEIDGVWYAPAVELTAAVTQASVWLIVISLLIGIILFNICVPLIRLLVSHIRKKF